MSNQDAAWLKFHAYMSRLERDAGFLFGDGVERSVSDQNPNYTLYRFKKAAPIHARYARYDVYYSLFDVVVEIGETYASYRISIFRDGEEFFIKASNDLDEIWDKYNKLLSSFNEIFIGKR